MRQKDTLLFLRTQPYGILHRLLGFVLLLRKAVQNQVTRQITDKTEVSQQ